MKVSAALALLAAAVCCCHAQDNVRRVLERARKQTSILPDTTFFNGLPSVGDSIADAPVFGDADQRGVQEAVAADNAAFAKFFSDNLARLFLVNDKTTWKQFAGGLNAALNQVGRTNFRKSIKALFEGGKKMVVSGTDVSGKVNEPGCPDNDRRVECINNKLVWILGIEETWKIVGKGFLGKQFACHQNLLKFKDQESVSTVELAQGLRESLSCIQAYTAKMDGAAAMASLSVGGAVVPESIIAFARAEVMQEMTIYTEKIVATVLKEIISRADFQA